MKSQGFTLIELIIILVIIGILAVSASPIFISDSGTKSQSARLQAMSILRSIQQQAMQNTGDTENNIELQVTQTTLGVPPYNEDNNLQISNSGIEFSPAGLTIGFDGLGRPARDCKGGCTITLKESSGIERVISINKEGFINAQ